MATKKEISVSAYDILNNRDKEKEINNIDIKEEMFKEMTGARITAFTSDESYSRVSYGGNIPTTPEIFWYDLEKTYLNKPVVFLKWRVPEFLFSTSELLGFNVYRKIVKSDLKFFDNLESRFAIERIGGEENYILESNQNVTSVGAVAGGPGTRPPLVDASSPSQISFAPTPDNVYYGQTESLPVQDSFENIAFVNYNDFTKIQNMTKVTVTRKGFVNVFFRDESVRYGGSYVYYVTAVSKNSIESATSNEVKMIINYFKPISKPVFCKSKYIQELNSFKASFKVNNKDNIYEMLVFRKERRETYYKYLVKVFNINDNISFTDTTIKNRKTYDYRIFVKNIFGVISDPLEFSKFIPQPPMEEKSRFNNLEDPIFFAIQNQDGMGVDIIVSPNDCNILYYKLLRKDVTIGETSFSFPSSIYTNYGGNYAWSDNYFYVEWESKYLNSSLKYLPDFPKDVLLKGIIFNDRAVELNHVYVYRLVGYDRFGNKTSAISTRIEVGSKKSIRPPINLFAKKIREYPMRFLIEWDNDFIVKEGTEDNYKYLVQRKRDGDNVYESFVLVSGRYIWDEFAASDSLSDVGMDKDFVLKNMKLINSNQPQIDTSKLRPYEQPPFLEPNSIYNYRVSVWNMATGEKSNFSDEIKISTFGEASRIEEVGFENMTNMFPYGVLLFWKIDQNALLPDHYVIERKTNVQDSKFKKIGSSYLKTGYFDAGVRRGKSYIYRIKAVNNYEKVLNFKDIEVNISNVR